MVGKHAIQVAKKNRLYSEERNSVFTFVNSTKNIYESNSLSSKNIKMQVVLTDSSFLISKEAACFSTHVDLIKVILKMEIKKN